MPFEIRMPKLSDTMEQGTVIRWIIAAGQRVSAGDPVAEVETDKADVEIEAEQGGVVSKIVVDEGGVASVGDVIAVLSDDGAEGEPANVDDGEGAAASARDDRDDGDGDQDGGGDQDGDGDQDGAAASKGRSSSPVESPPKAPTRKVETAESPPRAGERGEGGALASPVARELAEKGGVDLSQLRGSGPGGRIVKRDVERALANERPAAPPPVENELRGAESSTPSPAGEEATMSRMRRTIAARMEKAKRDIPHFYVRADVAADELVRLHETLRADEVIPGVTVTHLLLMAIARTLPRHPRLNALWVEDTIELMNDVNIGIVVALDDGLLVPVLKRAQDLGLKELVEQARGLVERTRKGKFRGDDLVGGSISVSNIGMLDVDELTPIINAPQASILGVGATRECAVARGGEVRVGHVMTLTLACDHRVVNGVEAGRFLQDLKHLLERPLALVVGP